MGNSAVIAGVGGYVPENVVTNDDLAQRFDTTDEWIWTRSGIRQRHFAGPGVSTGDLAVEAGARALASAGETAADMVVLATTTPDRPCPATAPEVASRLGLADVAAFDIAAVCSGFVYGLAVCAAQIQAGLADRVLLIGADTFSGILNPEDRATSVLFGDGAGAVLLRAGEPGEAGRLLQFDLGSDGSQADLITIRAGGSRQRLAGSPAPPADRYFSMNGRRVYEQAMSRMAASANAVLIKTGWRPADVEWFVAHQANRRILEMVASQLSISGERIVLSLDRFGNTAAASIPLALADAAAAGLLRAGNRTLLTAFGGGTTWGSVTLEWPELKDGE